MKEPLWVPEDDLLDVISVIRAGLNEVEVEKHVAEGLTEWCDNIEGYVNQED